MCEFTPNDTIISYVARAIILGVRLGSNMISGRSLLKITFTFLWKTVVAGSHLEDITFYHI